MALFIAGVVAALFVEWVLYFFWWKSRKNKSEDVVVMTVSEAEECANERSSLKNSVLDKDREINHLHARVAMLEEATDRSAQLIAGVKPKPETVVKEPEQVEVVNEVEQVVAEEPAPKVEEPSESPKKAAPKKKAPQQKKAATKAAVKKKAVVKKTAPKKMDVKKDPAADLRQLAKLKGVGPKLAELLAKDGFDSIDSIGKAKKADLQAVLEEAGARYASLDPSSWAAQAKLIADGDNAGLKKLQATLK